jgi:hypothetical protein
VKIQSWLDGFRMAMNWTVPRAPQPIVMADGSSSGVDGPPGAETIDVKPGVEQTASGSP